MKKLALNLIALICTLSPALLFANNNDDGNKLDPNESYTVRLHVETASGDFVLSEIDLENYMNAILFNEDGKLAPALDQLAILSEGKNLEFYQEEEVNRFYFAISKTKNENVNTLAALENAPCGQNDHKCKAIVECFVPGMYAHEGYRTAPGSSCFGGNSSYCIAYKIPNNFPYYIIPCQGN